MREFKVEKIEGLEYEEDKNAKRIKKFRNMKIKGYNIPAPKTSVSGLPSADTNVLNLLTQGLIMKHFKKIGDIETGEKIQKALIILLNLRKTETLLNTFIISLKN